MDDVSYRNKDELYARIDQLPGGVRWHCKEVVQEGNLKDDNGKPLTENLELWYRDPVECIQELLGNPMFKKNLAYAPARIYRDPEGKVRQIDEMWTGNWWWEIQVSRDTGSSRSNTHSGNAETSSDWGNHRSSHSHLG